MLAFCLHSHDVTEIVHAILSRTLMFGYKDLSHSLIAKAGEAGLSSGPIGIDFSTVASSIWNNSGDGRSSLYLVIAALRSTSFAQRTQAPTSCSGSRSDPGRAGHDRREDYYI